MERGARGPIGEGGEDKTVGDGERAGDGAGLRAEDATEEGAES